MTSLKRSPIQEDIKIIPAKAEDDNVLKWLREREPEHFLLKVESFSVLSESEIEKYESDEFEAAGYKWRLILYPKGDKKRNGSNHISLYLSLSDTKGLPQGWEAKVHFSLFVYNNISDKYLTIQVGDASSRRFHGLKREWGFAQLLPLDYFKDISNGYLFDDTCVFGAEVFVTKSAANRQCLSMMKETKNRIFTWKVEHFSTIKEDIFYSNKFKIGDLQWKLQLFPKGNANSKGKSLSLYLEVADELTSRANWKVYAEYTLRIRNQVSSNHIESDGSVWFSNSIPDWGYRNFTELSYLHDKSNGFIVDDTLVVEAEIEIAAVTKNFN
ncbi:hypothetical protein LguiB_022000 [Lonicera macranthoides]